MADIQITIKNLPEIKRAFNMSPTLMTRELNTAIRQSVLMIGGRSRINTPVDTGRLRASTYEHFSPLKGEVGTNTSYDLFVHGGTRFMPARPYLRKAVEQTDYEQFFTTAVQTVLNEIGRMT